MNKSSLSLALVLCAGTAQGATIAGPILSPINGHDYYLLAASSWTAAESEALTLGGHLATIRSDAENNFVFSTFGNYGGQPRDLWIGLNDAAQEGIFRWSSGEPFSYVPAVVDFPSDIGGEDYIHIIIPGGPTAGRWNDYPNEGGRPTSGVVEIVPEPSAALLACFGLGVLALRRRVRSSS